MTRCTSARQEPVYKETPPPADVNMNQDSSNLEIPTELGDRAQIILERGRRMKPASMLEELGLGTMYTDWEARNIVKALDRKRKQLDEEIAKFKAEKEKEYQLFEKNLGELALNFERKKDRNGRRPRNVEEASEYIFPQDLLVDRSSVPGDSSVHQRYRDGRRQSALSRSLEEASASVFLPTQQKVKAEELNTRKRESLLSYPHSQDPQLSRQTPVQSTGSRFQGSYKQEKETNYQSRQPTQHRPEDYSLTHEREVEFQGLFTPSYLPLLESTNHSPSSRSLQSDPHLISPKSESHLNTPPKDMKHPTSQSSIPTLSTVIHSADLLRSSLPIDTISRASTTSSPPLSSSIPPRPTSIPPNLHSSLRRPTSKPRSPKRVLFQIDNAVVSPNSTPPSKAFSSSTVHIMPWSNEPISSKDQTLVYTPSTHGTMIEEGRKQQTMGGEQRASGEAHGDPAPAKHKSKTTDQPERAAVDENDDGEPVAAEDDEEEMFAFDEEIGDEEAKKDDNNNDDDDGTRSTVSSHSSLKLGSPNAKSMPIDIKYPAKIDPRDE